MRDICHMCGRAELADYKECAGCGKHAQIRIRSRVLCTQCAYNHSGSDLVRKFIQNFQTPHPGNREAFEKIVQTIDPEDIKYERAARIIHFGKYLQSHALPMPLTWSAIDEMLEALPPGGHAAQHIRSCLLSLGHSLANEGRVESRAEHLLRRRLAERIGLAPEEGREAVGKFAAWSLDRKATYRHVIDQVDSVCSLWQWSREKGLNSIFLLNGEHINRYLLETFCDERCRCGGSVLRPSSDAAICSSCGSKGTFEQVPRQSTDVITKARSGIFMFFEWALLNHLVSTNPVNTRSPKPKKQIQHCSNDVLAALLGYVRAADSDPTDALILYLTTIHLFSGWELRMAEFPQMGSGSTEADLAFSYGFQAPQRSPSLGHASTGRSMQRITFPENARSWMEPLLRRFQHQRAEFLNGGKSKYLFVAPARIQNSVPVSLRYLVDRAGNITEDIVGFRIGLALLKKTGAVFTADTEGPQLVKQLGIGEAQAMAYRLFPRQLIG
ncbi:MAG TPA: hypothetical protein VHZ09_01935 [Acidobacteriaceae bacterium]|nr:hypothetical protein [Acidobacteriaceae bacterium]